MFFLYLEAIFFSFFSLLGNLVVRNEAGVPSVTYCGDTLTG